MAAADIVLDILNSAPVIVDVDDPASWPDHVARHVASVADEHLGSTEYATDLSLYPEDEDVFRKLLDGYLVLAYHCTRYLDHEVAWVRDGGMQRLSEELVRRRIDAAHDEGVITADERAALLDNSVFAIGEHPDREGQVCLFLSRGILDHSVAGIWNPMVTWGGEGIYFFTDRDSPLRQRLSGLGTPTVVVAGLDLSQGWRPHMVFPGALKSFVARYLRFDRWEADAFYLADIPPDHILDLWQPGNPQYDRHTALPRS